MSLNKRPRKVKLVWDTASEFHACIVTNENLTHNQASISGMEKDEENEIDLRKAVDAQANHLKHEIQTPEVNLRDDLIIRRSDLNRTTQTNKSDGECITSYTVISNIYPPDKDDEKFCTEENQSMVNLRWLFTLYSNGPDGFSNDLRYSQFPGMSMDEFKLLQLYYEKKVEKCKKDNNKSDQLLPQLERFRHQHNGSGSYSCFQPRPPKISTRRKFVVELKALQHCFEVRQNMYDIAGVAKLLHVRSLVDLKCARDWNSIGNQLERKKTKLKTHNKIPYNKLTCKVDMPRKEKKSHTNGLLKTVIPKETVKIEETTNENESNGVKPKVNGIKIEDCNGDTDKVIINGNSREGSSQSIENEKKKPESIREREEKSRSCSVEIGYSQENNQKSEEQSNSIKEDVEMMECVPNGDDGHHRRHDLLLPEVAKLDNFLKRKRTRYSQKWMRGFSPEKDLTDNNIRASNKQAYMEYLLSLLVDAKKDQDILLVAKRTAKEMNIPDPPAIRIETMEVPENWQSEEPIPVHYDEMETIFDAFKKEKFVDFEEEAAYVPLNFTEAEKNKLRDAFISRQTKK